MSQCTALEAIRISKLPKLNKVGSNFLDGCTSLKEAKQSSQIYPTYRRSENRGWRVARVYPPSGLTTYPA